MGACSDTWAASTPALFAIADSSAAVWAELSTSAAPAGAVTKRLDETGRSSTVARAPAWLPGGSAARRRAAKASEEKDAKITPVKTAEVETRTVLGGGGGSCAGDCGGSSRGGGIAAGEGDKGRVGGGVVIATTVGGGGGVVATGVEAGGGDATDEPTPLTVYPARAEARDE